MIHILLTILSVIGTVLLALLGIGVFLILILLFTPICYRGTVKKQEKAFFMAEQTDAAIEASGRSIRVCVTVYMRFPFGIWKGTGVNGAWLIQEKSEASEESPVTVIRRLRRIKRLQGEDEDHDGRRSEGDDRKLSGAGG